MCHSGLHLGVLGGNHEKGDNIHGWKHKLRHALKLMPMTGKNTPLFPIDGSMTHPFPMTGK